MAYLFKELDQYERIKACDYKPKPTAYFRFFKFCVVGPPKKCWRWRGYHSRSTGRPQFRLGGRVIPSMNAARAGWLLFFGPIPEETEVHHTCHNHLCMNPAHWELQHKFNNTADGNKHRKKKKYKHRKVVDQFGEVVSQGIDPPSDDIPF